MRFCLAVLISGWHDGHNVLGLCKPRAKKKKYKYNVLFFNTKYQFMFGYGYI